jgi:hypothetical protein
MLPDSVLYGVVPVRCPLLGTVALECRRTPLMTTKSKLCRRLRDANPLSNAVSGKIQVHSGGAVFES